MFSVWGDFCWLVHLLSQLLVYWTVSLVRDATTVANLQLDKREALQCPYKQFHIFFWLFSQHYFGTEMKLSTFNVYRKCKEFWMTKTFSGETLFLFILLVNLAIADWTTSDTRGKTSSWPFQNKSIYGASCVVRMEHWDTAIIFLDLFSFTNVRFRRTST